MIPCQLCRTVSASGLWEITEAHFKSSIIKHMMLCAQCGMTRVWDRRRLVDRSTDRIERVYMVKYTTAVKLLMSVTRADTPDSPGGLKPTALNVDTSQLAPERTARPTRLVHKFGGGKTITDKPRAWCEKCRAARDVCEAPTRKKMRVFCLTCGSECTPSIEG